MAHLVVILFAGGLVAGLAWGCAEALATSGRKKLGTFALVLGGALALLSARYGELAVGALGRGPGPAGVSAQLARVGLEALIADAIFGAGAALALGGPLLAVRAWGLPSPAQAVAQGVALLAWVFALLFWPWHSEQRGLETAPELVWQLLKYVDAAYVRQAIQTSVPIALALVFAGVQVLTFPILLDLVGPRVRRHLARSGLEAEEVRRERHPPARLRFRVLVLLLELLLVEVTLGPGTTLVVVTVAKKWEAHRSAVALRHLQDLAEGGDSLKAFQLGCLLLQRKDGEGLEWIRRAAALGQPNAIAVLGNGAEYGAIADLRFVVPKDEALALELYAKARDAGCVEAGDDFVRLAARRLDLPLARAWHDAELARLTSAASSGTAQSFLDLAEFDDKLGKTDEALECLRRAAQTGDAPAMFALATRLEGQDRLVPERAAWLECVAAVDTGDLGSQAARARGELAESGALGPADIAAATSWFEQAHQAKEAIQRRAGAGGR